jgi:hypothetical protein
LIFSFLSFSSEIKSINLAKINNLTARLSNHWKIKNYSFEMKSILVISFSSIQHDARVSREIDFLKLSYRITIAAFGANEIKLEKIFDRVLSLVD